MSFGRGARLAWLRCRYKSLFWRGMSLYYHLSRLFSFAIAAIALPASAQMVQPIPGVTAPDPVNTLSVHLRTLAASPRNLFALLGAGQAALDVGDPNAALGFFARADEIDARSGKAKAGLASALVMLEKPDDALRLFGEAVSLGISENNIVRDRGLAYDLRGDARRAQSLADKAERMDVEFEPKADSPATVSAAIARWTELDAVDAKAKKSGDHLRKLAQCLAAMRDGILRIGVHLRTGYI